VTLNTPTGNPIVDSVPLVTKPSSAFLFTERLMGGEIFATPSIDPTNGNAYMHIVGWDDDAQCEQVINVGEMSAYGEFDNEHHIPVRLLDIMTSGKANYQAGGSYIKHTDWDYPFHGERIGAWVTESR